MSKTNQVCICCTQRDTCQYYNPNRTHCVPVMTEQEMQFELMKSQEKVNELRQEVSSMNKEREFWEQVRIQAAIAAMQAYINDGERMALVSKKFDYEDEAISKFIAKGAVMYADALIEELQGKEA